MPDTITSTTVRALRDAIETRIAALTPSDTFHGSGGWVRHSGGRFPQSSGRVPRYFWLTLAAGGPAVDRGTTGMDDYEATVAMSVVTWYRAFPIEEYGPIVESDHEDLMDDLSHALDPTITGLMFVDDDGWVLLNEEEQQISHDFTFRYMRARS